MGKDQRLRYSKKEAKENVKMVFTHGKKKTAVANAVVARGTGVITVNRIPIQNVEPKNLRIKIFEPILLLGAEQFKDLRTKVDAMVAATISDANLNTAIDSVSIGSNLFDRSTSTALACVSSISSLFTFGYIFLKNSKTINRKSKLPKKSPVNISMESI